MAKTTRDEYHAQRVKSVKAEFERHEIVQRSTGRWLLQKRHPDGKPDWTMAAEAVCLAGGNLYVGGDIHPVVFAHCNDPPRLRVYWLGAHEDITYYVAQKASIGMGSQVLVTEYNSDVAYADIDALMAEYVEYHADVVPDDPMLVALRDIQGFVGDGHGRILDMLRLAAGEHECEGFMEERYDIGMVTAPRIYCAWGALAKLTELLKKEEANGDRQQGEWREPDF